MTTIKTWLSESAPKLSSAGIESARLDCLLLLSFVLKKEKTWILANPNNNLTEDNLLKLDKLIKRRTEREPIAYLTGKTEFYGLTLSVDKNTLIPRPETEEIVTLAAQMSAKNAKILELGTGSGAISIALRSLLSDSIITATDISNKTLDIAKENAAKYSFDDINFVNSDLMDDISDDFSLIVANLPYLRTDEDVSPETKYEPQQALYSSDDGLAHYKQMFRQIDKKRIMKKHGRVIIELNPWQKNTIINYAKQFDFEVCTLKTSDFILVLEKVV